MQQALLMTLEPILALTMTPAPQVNPHQLLLGSSDGLLRVASEPFAVLKSIIFKN